MCGACGTRATTWTERLAPLDARAGHRRARALTALVGARPGVAVAPWAGGGLRLRLPGGDRFAPSLPDAAALLTRRLGPLVPGELSCPRDVPAAESTAVWCAAAHAAGAALTLVTAGHRVELGPDGVVVRPADGATEGIAAAPVLAAHWRRWSAA